MVSWMFPPRLLAGPPIEIYSVGRINYEGIVLIGITRPGSGVGAIRVGVRLAVKANC